MVCKYFYKGRLIGNEIQLNDFLIERRKLHSKYGDVVFQTPVNYGRTLQIIDEKIVAESSTWKEKMDLMWANGGRLYDNDGEKLIKYDRQHPPFIGVNKYISHFGDDGNNNRLTAEFKSEEYWIRMFAKWNSNNFQDDDKLVDIIMQVTGDDPRTMTGPFLEDTLKTWRLAIESKWLAQGEIGTALHAVSEFYFNKTGDVYNYETIDVDINQAYDNFPEEFRKKVNINTFTNMVKMCQRLKTDLKQKYGENCIIYPEIAMTCNTTEEILGSRRIYGIVDLLVIDEQGIPHIIDYKTSDKDYNQFHATKKLTYTYQLAVYERILSKYGIRTDNSTSTIIPIKIKNMRYDQDAGAWVYDDISYNSLENSTQVQYESVNTKNEHIVNNINKFIPPTTELSLHADHLQENVTKTIKTLFPKYQIQRNSSDEELATYLRERGAFTPDPKTGDYQFQFSSGGDPITVESSDPNPELTMLKKVRAEINSWTVKKQNLVGRVKNEFKRATESGTPFLFPDTYRVEGDPLWLEQTMNLYCDGNYEIIECDGIENFGMIFIQNVHTKLVTVIKLTSSPDLTIEHKFDKKNRKNLTGKYEDDVIENSKSDSRMLKAVQGNIELMEAMVVLLNLNVDNDSKMVILEFKVINPYTLSSLPASNKEILYSYSKLMRLAKTNNEDCNTDTSNFKGTDAKISLISPMESIRIKLKEIIRLHTDKHKMLNDYVIKAINDFNSATEVIDPDGLYKELYKLAQAWESEEGYKDATSVVRNSIKDVTSPEYRLYADIMIAMADLKNLDVRQQIKDASNWLQNPNILKHGMEGLYVENPGNFKSQTLNQITISVSNVYQKIKDSVNRKNAKLRTLVENLKKEKGFGYLQNNITGNQTSLYENMIEERNGDLVFVNPDKLHGAERAFLEYVLELINENRYPNDKANFESWKRNNDLRYYRVPLMRASDASRMSTKGNLAALKDGLRTWTVKGALQELKEKAQGFLSKDEEEKAYAKENIFKMSNMFDWGESDKRLDKIKLAGGVNTFEQNLEDLVLHHCFAYDLTKEMNKEMPLIKAAAVSLAVQGSEQNLKDGFHNIIDFMEKYVQSKVKNQSINDEKYRDFEGAIGKARKVASFMALAFSPVQFTYQMVEHIWKSISLIIRKPDGTNAFTVENMWTSLKHVYKQLSHFSDTPSEMLLLNEAYGINDMDSLQYAQRISSNQGFLTHLSDWAFRMASRADFYSRMSIFEALMRKDGSFEAHEVKDGLLVYNYEKDKRYAGMFNSPRGSDEYNEAYSRYLAAAKQFQNEGVLNADGTEFKIGDPLPRAYTNKEASAMKAIADNIYGYYNNETKSMMGSILVGGLMTQMKTYWSAKKNQYLAPEGVKLLGHFEYYKELDENGELKQLYYAKNQQGEIDINAPFVTEEDPNCSKVKVQQWKGRWLEGIVSTLYKLGEGALNGRAAEEWEELWNHPDENLRTAYRSNIIQISYDLILFVVGGMLCSVTFGDWEEEKEKDWRKDKGDTGKALDYVMANFLFKTFNNSLKDFNMIASIGDPLADWQPFAFSTLQNTVSRLWDAAMDEDKTFTNAISKSFAATRLVEPIFSSLAYEE